MAGEGSITWSGNFGGLSAGSNGRTITLSGSAVPSGKEITGGTIRVGLSATYWSSNHTWDLYFVYVGSTYFVNGNPAASETMTGSNSGSEGAAGHGVTANMSNLDWFKNNTSGDFTIKANTSRSDSTSYMRSVVITVNYKDPDPVTPTYTNCGAPTYVTVSHSRGVVTIGWGGATAGTNNAITGYQIIRNTSQSESGATTTHSNVTTSGQTNSPGAGTFYYGVKTIGTVSGYDSGYTWSGGITLIAKPSVSRGEVLTKSKMDTLRTWINGGTAVTRYDVVWQSVGNTYNAATKGATVDAAWYNQ